MSMAESSDECAAYGFSDQYQDEVVPEREHKAFLNYCYNVNMYVLCGSFTLHLRQK